MSLQPFSLWQPIASGAHSIVWRAQKAVASRPSSSDDLTKAKDLALGPVDDLSHWVAVKVVQDNRTLPPHDIVREAAILRELSHPNIIDFVDFVQGDRDAPYALYMPLIPLCLTSLLSSPFFTPFPLTGPYSALSRPIFAPHDESKEVFLFDMTVKSLVYQLILAIAYLHSLDPPISHRDINPGNVLIDHEGTVKLVDFGIAWSTRHTQVKTEGTSMFKSSPRRRLDNWTETEESMCCEVATGPYRAPELLFSPPSYSAPATDLWSLGATIAQFYSPLELVPSHTPVPSPSAVTPEEGDHLITRPFIISSSLKTQIDYGATWERRSLFDGTRGELGLVWSIFKLRGTPDEETWPDFNSLPDVNKLEFRKTTRQPLHVVLPHLSPPWISESASMPSSEHDKKSPLSLIDTLLDYQPASRLPAAQALHHQWFASGIILPLTYPGPNTNKGFVARETQTHWAGRTLGTWLEPIIKREAGRLAKP